MIRVEEVNNAERASQLAAEDVVNALTARASGHNLFLVSGGSSVRVADWAASNLDINVTNSTVIGQVDERYGPVGHDDSNWRHLREKGLNPGIFENSLEMLAMGSSAEDIAATYDRRLRQQLEDADFSLAILGLGADGHIAGILPMGDKEFSELFLDTHLATSFEGPDYDRITITAALLMSLDKIVMYADGPKKAKAIARLNEPQSVSDYPAEILKQCKDVTMYYGKGM